MTVLRRGARAVDGRWVGATLLAALGFLLLPGCQLSDFCQPADDSEVTLLVEQGVDDTDPWTFGTIQAALDASDGRPTTVCVPRGLYLEELRVPGGVHLLGEGTSAVRLRPPDANGIPHPGFVDSVLLTLEAPEQESATVQGIDVGGAAICVDAVGAGTTLLTGVRLADCAVGLRGAAGGVTIRDSAVGDHSSWAVHVSGMHALALEGLELSGCGAATRAKEDRPVFEGAWTPAAALDGIGSGGVLRAADVAALSMSGLTITGNWFGSAVIDLVNTSAVIADSAIDVRAVVTSDGPRLAGSGAALAISGGTTDLRRVRVESDGQPLVTGRGSPSTLLLDSVAWDGRGDGPEPADEPNAAIDLDGGGELVAVHLTLVGDGATPALRLGADAELEVVNSIAWGHADGDGLVIADGATVAGPGVSFSLFQDPDLDGPDMVSTGDPDLRDDLSPRSSSPARCAGDPAALSALDLNGDPRPFEAGKDPDLGAVERQEPCSSR